MEQELSLIWPGPRPVTLEASLPSSAWTCISAVSAPTALEVPGQDQDCPSIFLSPLLSMIETSAEPSLQAKQLKLKRARLADDLNEKIAQRPGPMELVEKNILPVESSLKEAIIGEVA